MDLPKKNYFVDKDVQLLLGTLLRVGVLISSGVILLGGIIFFTTQANEAVSFATFNPERAKFSSISAIFAGVKTFDGLAIVQFGVLLLIFTPIARVVFSIFSFLIEKDYMYVAIGIIVLCVIITSLYLDVAH
jgi:uncharacterized membrane protein